MWLQNSAWAFLFLLNAIFVCLFAHVLYDWAIRVRAHKFRCLYKIWRTNKACLIRLVRMSCHIQSYILATFKNATSRFLFSHIRMPHSCRIQIVLSRSNATRRDVHEQVVSCRSKSHARHVLCESLMQTSLHKSTGDVHFRYVSRRCTWSH